MKNSVITVLGIGLFIYLALPGNMNSTKNYQPMNSQDPSGQQETSADEHREIINTMREKGIREAAKIKGGLIINEPPHSWLQYGMEELVKHSSLIVVGTALSNECRITFSGDDIETVYQVSVEKVLKGNDKKLDLITVGLPGGRVEFGDGTFAEIRTPGFKKMVNGDRYILFLDHTLKEPGKYELTGGIQGLFEISRDDNRVMSHGYPSSELYKQYKEAAKGRVDDDIREMLQKWPEYIPCCNKKKPSSKEGN